MPFYGPRFGFDRRLQVSKTCRVRTNSLIMIQQFKIDVTVTDDPKETIIEFQALV